MDSKFQKPDPAQFKIRAGSVTFTGPDKNKKCYWYG